MLSQLPTTVQRSSHYDRLTPNPRCPLESGLRLSRARFCFFSPHKCFQYTLVHRLGELPLDHKHQVVVVQPVWPSKWQLYGERLSLVGCLESPCHWHTCVSIVAWCRHCTLEASCSHQWIDDYNWHRCNFAYLFSYRSSGHEWIDILDIASKPFLIHPSIMQRRLFQRISVMKLVMMRELLGWKSYFQSQSSRVQQSAFVSRSF